MTWDAFKRECSLLHHKGYTFHPGFLGEGYYLQIRFPAIDAKTEKLEMQFCRKWYISTHATRSELIQTALLACIQAAEHEVREHFRYAGVTVFDPHANVYESALKNSQTPLDVRQPTQ